MSSNIVITIARQFGSGGHEIGRRLSKRLNIPMYDKELITHAAEESGFSGTDYKGTVSFANEDYRNLTVDISSNTYDITEEDIDAEVAAFADYLAEWKDVTDRPVANGDTAKIDYVGTVDGVEFEGGSATDADLEIGSHSFIDDFEEQLIGANIGDEVKVEVTFPEEYHAPEMAGKDAVFMVTIKGISEYIVPEMTDEAAKELGYTDLAEIRAEVTATLEENMQAQREDDIFNAIWAQVESIVTVEIDETVKQEYVDKMITEYENYAASSGADLETMLATFGMTVEDFNAYCASMAETEISYFMIVQALAEEFGIKVDEASYEDGCMSMLAQMGLESKEAFEEANGMSLEEYYTKPAIVDYVLSNAVKEELQNGATVVE